MAWQLIYTSAPRLLEAGRSGFGTVARHRAIHPILAAALERDSQFDRSAVRGRVVFAHRIIAAGGSRFHVLSCIRETGADYTGRTNHIAHHLIIDPREVSYLGSAAPSPVDVCRGMSWRTAWPDAPKWLEASDEISLAQFHPATTPGGAWQAIAGDARYAGVLRPATSSVLIVPPDADALALFAESLTVAASQAWQATFTNCIQPTDDLSEFRWVAVEAASPMRERATGGRTVLDLTAPKTLPAPPVSRTNLSIPASDSVRSTLSTLPAKLVGNLFDAQLAAHVPRAQKGALRKSGLVPYIVVLLLLAAGAIYWGFGLFFESQEVESKRTEIRRIVTDALQDNSAKTSLALSQVGREKLDAAIRIAESAREIRQALDAAAKNYHGLEQKSFSEDDWRAALEESERKKVTEEIMPLVQLNELHQGIQSQLKSLIAKRKNGEKFIFQDLEELKRGYTRLQGISSDNSKSSIGNLSNALRDKGLKEVGALWMDGCLNILTSDKQLDKSSYRDFVKLLDGVLPASDKPQQAVAIVAHWQKLEEAGDNREKISAICDDIKLNPNTGPKWLLERADARIAEIKTKELSEKRAEAEKAQEAALAAIAKRQSVGKVIFVTNPKATEEWSEIKKEIGSGKSKIFKGGWDSQEKLFERSDKEGKREYLKDARTNKREFKYDGDSGFLAENDAPLPPYKLLLKRDDETIVTAFILNADKPLHEITGGIRRDGNKLMILDPEVQRLCKGAGAINLEMEFPQTCKDLSLVKAPAIKLPIKGKEGGEVIVDFTPILTGMEKQKQALLEQKKLNETNAEKTSPWGNILALAKDLKDLGTTPIYEDIWKRASSLEELVKAKKVISADFLAIVRKELEVAKTKLPLPDASDPKKKEAGQRERNEKSAQISSLLNRIEKIRSDIPAMNTPEATEPDNGTGSINQRLEGIKNHNLLKSELPLGDYTIFAKNFPFIRFRISKPQ